MSDVETVRRFAAIGAIALMAAFPFGAGRSSAAITPDNAIIDGAALASAAVAVAAFTPNFDFWPVYSNSSINNSLSHGLSAGFWPGFLLDATFFSYGFQEFERSGLGISESQYPNQPHRASASSTAFMRSNFGVGCEFVFGPGPGTSDTCKEYASALFTPPGSIGESETTSGPLTSTGSARNTRFTLPGVVDAQEVVSKSSSRFDRALGRTVTEATFTARNVVLADTVHIDKIVAVSTAVAGGDPDSSSATSVVNVVGARMGNSVVHIDDQGMHIQGDEGLNSLNQAFAARGLEVRLVQGRQVVGADGHEAMASTGGLRIRMAQQRAEENFPALVRQNKDTVCRASEQSIFNQEITRISQTFPNPLYGRVPLVPRDAVPKDVTVNQSVPPPVSCPFTNRDMELAIVLGKTDASARLTPLPDFGAFAEGTFAGGPAVAADAPAADAGSFEPFATETGTGFVPSGTSRRASRGASPAVALPATRPVVAMQTESDVAGRVKLAYAVLGAMSLVAMGGPFAMRRLTSLR